MQKQKKHFLLLLMALATRRSTKIKQNDVHGEIFKFLRNSNELVLKNVL